jgi:hypothetical protein
MNKNTIVISALCLFGLTAPALACVVNAPNKPVTFINEEPTFTPARERAREVSVTVLPETRIVVNVNVPKRATKKLSGPVTCELGFIDGTKTVRVYKFCASPLFRASAITKSL